MPSMGLGDLGYLVIGHVTQDQKPEGGHALGGTVTYAARTAMAMGMRAGVITSGPESLDLAGVLPGVPVLRVPSPVATTFDNRYSAVGREQTIRAVATPLTPLNVPLAWQTAKVVHLGPVARECDPAMVEVFPGAFVGLTPQGWMRNWDEKGCVRQVFWETAQALLPRADAVVLGDEDLAGDESVLVEWATSTRILVVTRGARGCTVYAVGETRDFPGLPSDEVDPTGAGDIFATVFFVRLWRGDDPWAAARFANCIAAASVTRSGLLGTPTSEEIARCRAVCD